MGGWWYVYCTRHLDWPERELRNLFWNHLTQVASLEVKLQGHPQPGKHWKLHCQTPGPGSLAGPCPGVRGKNIIALNGHKPHVIWWEIFFFLCLQWSWICRVVMGRQPDSQTQSCWGCIWGHIHQLRYTGRLSLCYKWMSRPSSALDPPSLDHKLYPLRE